MAASTNPSAGGHSNVSNGANGNVGGPEKMNGGASAAVVPTPKGLRHNPGISRDWTPEEQLKLEDFHAIYASDTAVSRYAKIAQELKDKTVRDIALRCRWMSKKENGKRRKDDNSPAMKHKVKKEKVTDPLPKSSQVANRTNGPAYAQSMMSMESDDGIPFNGQSMLLPLTYTPGIAFAIGVAAGQVIEHVAEGLDQVTANFSVSKSKVIENINLLREVRANLVSLLHDSSGLDMMKQMPPLPVKLNEELANLILNLPLPLP